MWSSRWRTLLVVLALIGVMGWARHRSDESATAVFRHDLRASQLEVPAPPVQSDRSSYAFLRIDDAGRPVRFDPCRAIHYEVHIGHGPLNGTAIVHEAIARLSTATGLQFVFDGTTDVVLRDIGDRKLTDPVWIGWANADETTAYGVAGSPSLDTVGVGGPVTARRPDGREVYVTGAVVLKPTFALRAGFGPGKSEGNVVLHELGHLVGLAHVANLDELMNTTTGPGQHDGYGVGDLEGLYLLGAAPGCL
jgi:hypothetical protein